MIFIFCCFHFEPRLPLIFDLRLAKRSRNIILPFEYHTIKSLPLSHILLLLLLLQRFVHFFASVHSPFGKYVSIAAANSIYNVSDCLKCCWVLDFHSYSFGCEGFFSEWNLSGVNFKSITCFFFKPPSKIRCLKIMVNHRYFHTMIFASFTVSISAFLLSYEGNAKPSEWMSYVCATFKWKAPF